METEEGVRQSAPEKKFSLPQRKFQSHPSSEKLREDRRQHQQQLRKDVREKMLRRKRCKIAEESEQCMCPDISDLHALIRNLLTPDRSEKCRTLQSIRRILSSSDPPIKVDPFPVAISLSTTFYTVFCPGRPRPVLAAHSR